MGFEREALSELYASVWGNRSKMQRSSRAVRMASHSFCTSSHCAAP